MKRYRTFSSGHTVALTLALQQTLLNVHAPQLTDHELAYSDMKPIEKGWQFLTFNDEDWSWLPSFRFKLLSHSTNWSMGSLNIMMFNTDIEIGKWSWSLCYKFEIHPPKWRRYENGCKN